jgi:hypothetical protein
MLRTAALFAAVAVSVGAFAVLAVSEWFIDELSESES